MRLLLQDFPPELVLMITEYLNYPDYFATRKTSRYIRNVLPKLVAPFKNLKNTLLYQTYGSPFTTNSLITLAKTLLVNAYDFSDFYASNKFDKIVVPSAMLELTIKEDHTFPLPRYGDILKNIIIQGNGIKKAELFIGENLVWTQHFSNAKMVRITPFDFGIIVVALFFSTVKLHITAESLAHVYAKYLILDTTDRMYLTTTVMTFDYYYFGNYGHHTKRLYTRAVYGRGAFGLLV